MRHTLYVRSAFELVIWIVCGLGIVIAVLALVGSGQTWESFGRNRLVMDRELRRPPPPGSAAALDERDDEIRQLLEARNARRARRGEAPIDVEAEFRRLTAPQLDDELRAEIRDLVVARNHRRIRAGKPPLDVEAEIERQIADLPPL
jgi:hypothetical protein